MLRSPVSDVLWLTVLVGLGAIVGGSLNAAVAAEPVETVYQWMRGVACGGVAAAVTVWVARFRGSARARSP